MPAKQKYHIHNDEVYEKRNLHSFLLADVEDPELYCAGPIYDWQQTEQGQWVMKHALDPTFHIIAEPMTYGYRIVITGHVTAKRWTEYCLRFS